MKDCLDFLFLVLTLMSIKFAGVLKVLVLGFCFCWTSGCYKNNQKSQLFAAELSVVWQQPRKAVSWVLWLVLECRTCSVFILFNFPLFFRSVMLGSVYSTQLLAWHLMPCCYDCLVSSPDASRPSSLFLQLRYPWVKLSWQELLSGASAGKNAHRGPPQTAWPRSLEELLTSSTCSIDGYVSKWPPQTDTLVNSLHNTHRF